MKKQELIHTHALLAKLVSHIESCEGENVENPKYESKNIRPTSIQKSKAAHQEAVITLSEELSESLDEPIEKISLD